VRYLKRLDRARCFHLYRDRNRHLCPKIGRQSRLFHKKIKEIPFYIIVVYVKAEKVLYEIYKFFEALLT